MNITAILASPTLTPGIATKAGILLSIKDKIRTLVKEIYGGRDIVVTPKAEKQIEVFKH